MQVGKHLVGHSADRALRDLRHVLRQLGADMCCAGCAKGKHRAAAAFLQSGRPSCRLGKLALAYRAVALANYLTLANRAVALANYLTLANTALRASLQNDAPARATPYPTISAGGVSASTPATVAGVRAVGSAVSESMVYLNRKGTCVAAGRHVWQLAAWPPAWKPVLGARTSLSLPIGASCNECPLNLNHTAAKLHPALLMQTA